MGEATQATQSLPEIDDGEDEAPKEKVWGRLISLNPVYPNVELTGIEVVLGRQSCCNVQYNDNLNISGKHCRIFREPSANGFVIAFVQDMSTNGTFVNGDKLGKGNRLLLSSGFEIALVLNKKKTQDKVAYIFQECAEDKPHEEGGPQKKYDIREALGAGNFAVVKLAINKATGGRFAIKIIDKKKYLNQAGSRKEALMDEVKILRSLNHKNIIHIEEMFDTEKTLYLVLELIEGGDLSGDISREGQYTETKARDVFGQIIAAIVFLHNQGIAHRDLKPENILLKTATIGDKDVFDVKLSDFGLSRTIGEGSFMKTMCGTPQYLAPEIITSGGIDGYGKEVDMWSAGAILYVLLCGYPPFDDNKSISIFDQIRKGLVDFPDAPWSTVSPSAKDLIKRLLTVDPNKRYTANQTQVHPWMKGEDTVPVEMEQDEVTKEDNTKPTSNPTSTQNIKHNTNSTNNNVDYGSVINYNTTEDKTSPSTPVTPQAHTSSHSSTPNTNTNTPITSANTTPTSNSPPSTHTNLTPTSSPDTTNKNGDVKKFESVGFGDKRKRDDDDDATDEDEPLPVLSKSSSKVKQSPPTPNPPATKKLKKSATAEILNDDEDGETSDNEKEKSPKSSSSNLLKHTNSFTTNGDDNEDEEDGGKSKGKGGQKGGKKKDVRPKCMYGAACYRKNPAHLKEFQHPNK